MLLDKKGAVAERYQVYALPATFVVNRRGMVVGTVLGGATGWALTRVATSASS